MGGGIDDVVKWTEKQMHGEWMIEHVGDIGDVSIMNKCKLSCVWTIEHMGDRVVAIIMCSAMYTT